MFSAYKVLLPLPVDELTYLAPLAGTKPVVGARIVVPWQNGLRIGIVTSDAPVVRDQELRHAVAILDDRPYVSAAFVEQILASAAALNQPAGTYLTTLAVPGLTENLRHEIEKDGEWKPAHTYGGEELETLRTNALITERVFFEDRFVEQLCATELAGVPEGSRAEAQRIALGVLRQEQAVASAAALARMADVSPSAVRALITKGFAEYRETYVDAQPPESVAGGELYPEPREGEALAHGAVITGAIRTYRLAAAADTISASLENGSWLVLVPEQRFVLPAAKWLAAALAPHPVFALHDAKSREALFDSVPDTPSVVVTTFSGLGIPLLLAGVVITDYRHDSYKLLSGARPWVDQFAEKLAERAGANTLYTAQLPFGATVHRFPDNRLDLPLPSLRIHAADMNASNTWPLHQDAQLVISQTVKRGRQALIIAPRRGYSAAYACTECQWRGECPNCTLALKYHDGERRLKCHQCGHDEAAPSVCPSCGERALKPEMGAGVERFEQVVTQGWPALPIYRLDSDRRDDIAPLLAGAPGIVITTRSGLRLPPLPGLGLIIFAQFDIIRTVGDYRALDIELAMLYETAELRAPGKQRPLVVVQTYEPGEDALQALLAENPADALSDVSEAHLARRKRFRFPPFAELTRVQFSGRNRNEVEQAAEDAVGHLEIAGASELEILGPAPAVIPRQRGQFVYQFLLRTTDRQRAQELLQHLPKRYSGARMSLDIGALHTGDLLF